MSDSLEIKHTLKYTHIKDYVQYQICYGSFLTAFRFYDRSQHYGSL